MFHRDFLIVLKWNVDKVNILFRNYSNIICISSLPESRNPSKGSNPVFSKSMENLLDISAKIVDIPDISMWKKLFFNHALLN